jgi:ABC-type multidrug transport system fused ATPase/permease subunit
MAANLPISPKDFWKLLRIVMGADTRKYLTWNLVLALMLGYGLVPPFLVGKIVDFLTQYQAGESWYNLYFYIALLGSLAVVVAHIRLITKRILTELAITAAYRARVYGFERLMNQSIQWHEGESTGNKIQRVATGSTELESFLILLSGDILNVVIVVFTVVAYFFIANPLFGLIGLSHVFLFMSIQYYFTCRVSGLVNDSKQAAENASGVYIEGAANILTIKTLNLQAGITKRVTAKEEAARALKVRISSLIFWKWRFFQTLHGFVLATFVYVVSRDVLIGHSSAGDLLILFTYFRSLHEGLGDSTGMIDRFIEYVVSLGRLAPVFEDKGVTIVGTALFPKNWSSIELKNINARYQSDRGGLNDFSLSLRKGEHIGIVGSSGSGKSTFAKVLMGVQPIQSGSYLISGVSYSSITPTETSNAMSMVLQDCELFNATFAENIAAMREVSEERIVEAIRISGLNSIVEKLAQGIDTKIGEKGYRLSGGERQRLGIARAICKDPDILVLDEATSALDGETEAQIHQLLFSELKDKTLIIIAHRLSTVKQADKILVLENGRIIETGTHADLILRSGLYARLAKLQFTDQ